MWAILKPKTPKLLMRTILKLPYTPTPFGGDRQTITHSAVNSEVDLKILCGPTSILRATLTFKTIISPTGKLQKRSEFRTKYGADLACSLARFPCAFLTRAQTDFCRSVNLIPTGVRTAGRSFEIAPALGIQGAPKEWAPQEYPHISLIMIFIQGGS